LVRGIYGVISDILFKIFIIIFYVIIYFVRISLNISVPRLYMRYIEYRYIIFSYSLSIAVFDYEGIFSKGDISSHGLLKYYFPHLLC